MNVNVGHGLQVNLPVPEGWTVVHEMASRKIVVSAPSDRRSVTFQYDFYGTAVNGVPDIGRPAGVFLKDNALVSRKAHGRRCNASTALEALATMSGILRP